MYHYAGNNPVKYTDPDGRHSVDYHSIEELNDCGRYRSNLKVYDFYLNECIKINKEIKELRLQVIDIQNKNLELDIQFYKQPLNDFFSVLSILGKPVIIAFQESNGDIYSFCGSVISNIDPQTLAETLWDYYYSDRLTRYDFEQAKVENDNEIYKLNCQISSLEKTLETYEKEMEKLRKEMNGDCKND